MVKIYKAYCNVTGKVYIGQTARDLEVRIREHLGSKDRKFQRALAKYGSESFTWTVLEECNTRDEANQREVILISEYDSYSNGYNSHIGGQVGGFTTADSIRKRQQSRAENGGYSSVKKRQSGDGNVSKRPEVKTKIATSVAELWKDPEYRAHQLLKRQEANPVVKCPYCSKEGRKQIMQRWHFNNCKKKNG